MIKLYTGKLRLHRFIHLFLSPFFSSRRRHPRLSRDWSSDVCSSDLGRIWSILALRTARKWRFGILATLQPRRFSFLAVMGNWRGSRFKGLKTLRLNKLRSGWTIWG